MCSPLYESTFDFTAFASMVTCVVEDRLSHATDSSDGNLSGTFARRDVTYLLPTSSRALHVDMPASLMADSVYQPESDFVTLSISKHWRPEPS